MKELGRSMDYDDPLLAEIYDQQETGTEDVELIRTLLPSQAPLSILECFSGTGRILIPLAQDGHRLTGIEISEAMTARARGRLAALGEEVRSRVRLVVADVLIDDWGKGYDVVLLGGNCLFELPSPESQEECVRRASECLVSGGHLFVDTTDGSGHGADPSEIGTEWIGLKGTASDGTHVKLSAKVLDVDTRGVSHFTRTWHKKRPDGTEETVKYAACKYPVSGDEIAVWLDKYGLQIVEKYQDYARMPYERGGSGRAIFWARKP
jgi:SAM-dependent methyltransferase